MIRNIVFVLAWIGFEWHDYRYQRSKTVEKLKYHLEMLKVYKGIVEQVILADELKGDK